MAKGKKTGGKDFVPGDPRAGRPPMPAALRAGRRLNRTEFEELVNKYLWMSTTELELATEDKSLPAIEAYFANVVKVGTLTGDHSRMEFILQRLLGKVKDQLEVTTPKPYVIHRLDGTQTVLGTKLIGEGSSDDEAL